MLQLLYYYVIVPYLKPNKAITLFSQLCSHYYVKLYNSNRINGRMFLMNGFAIIDSCKQISWAELNKPKWP